MLTLGIGNTRFGCTKSSIGLYSTFQTFVEEAEDVDWENITEEYFLQKLTQFLYSPRGAKYKTQFKFSSNLHCGDLAPSVLVSSINYQHMGFESASEWVPAMDR